jgi:hypothetical protein
MADKPPPTAASRRRLVLARVLTVIAVLLAVVSVLANFVKREALDESQFRETSRALIADPTVRNQVAATLVDQLYANVDVSGALQQQLPKNLKGLAGPIAGASRDLANRSAQRLLERPRVQDAFVNATSAAQHEFVDVLDGNTRALETSGGNVVLDTRPLVLDLGNRFSFVSNLQSRIPQSSGKITIIRSDELKAAQDGTKLLRFVADWIWVLALAAAAAAVYLARGRRRIELRAQAIGILIVGALILIVRTLLGRYLVDHLVVSDSVRPAVSRAYDILTDLLHGDGWTAIIIGLVALVGIWLSGPRHRAVTARRALAPYLNRAEIAYSAYIVGYLLLLWWKPTPQFGFWRTIIVWFVLGLIGVEALRRQSRREFPDAEPADMVAAVRGFFGRRERREVGGGAGELERLARLHAEGSLNDAEFAAAKSRALGV